MARVQGEDLWDLGFEPLSHTSRDPSSTKRYSINWPLLSRPLKVSSHCNDCARLQWFCMRLLWLRLPQEFMSNYGRGLYHCQLCRRPAEIPCSPIKIPMQPLRLQVPREFASNYGRHLHDYQLRRQSMKTPSSSIQIPSRQALVDEHLFSLLESYPKFGSLGNYIIFMMLKYLFCF